MSVSIEESGHSPDLSTEKVIKVDSMIEIPDDVKKKLFEIDSIILPFFSVDQTQDQAGLVSLILHSKDSSAEIK